jgi:hypothetical protein
MTISSSEALPARSPRPLIVHSTWRAPARTAASELATARPRSLWQCTDHTTLSELGTRSIRLRMVAANCSGHVVADGVGHVDGLRAGLDHGLEDAHQEIDLGAAGVLGRELDVVGVFARPADRLHRLLDDLVGRHAQLLLHVDRAGGDEGVDAAARRRAMASPERRMSFSLARASEHTVDSLIASAIERTASKSPLEAAAKPASMTSTRMRSSWRAMRSFSSRVIERPGSVRRRARWCRK